MAMRPNYSEIALAHLATDYQGWTDEIVLPSDPVLRGIGGDFKSYRSVLNDDQVAATFQQRRRALTSKEWDVEPASESAIDQEAAQFIKDQLEDLQWDRITDQMLYGVYYGYAVGECLWGRDGNRVILETVRVRDPQRFRFDKDRNLRLLTRDNPKGMVMPPRKFWTFSAGGENGDDPYGRGLASWLYWPVFFKRNAAKFWAIAVEKFAMPTPVGKHPAGAPEDVKRALLDACLAIATDKAVTIPETTQIDFLETLKRVGADHLQFLQYWDGAIAKIVLSQTMTTDNGSSRSQAEVHMDVRDDVIKADADLISESFNDGPVTWLTEWNFPGAEPPKVWRNVEPPDDLKEAADRDKILYEIGFKPTEDYIRETYGDGYEARQDISQDIARTPPDGRGRPNLTADVQSRGRTGQDQGADGEDDAAFAEPETDGTDDLAARLEDATAGDIDAMVGQLRGLLDGSSGLSELSERLLTANPEIGIDGLADTIAKAMIVADLSGQTEDPEKSEQP